MEAIKEESVGFLFRAEVRARRGGAGAAAPAAADLRGAQRGRHGEASGSVRTGAAGAEKASRLGGGRGREPGRAAPRPARPLSGRSAQLPGGDEPAPVHPAHPHRQRAGPPSTQTTAATSQTPSAGGSWDGRAHDRRPARAAPSPPREGGPPREARSRISGAEPPGELVTGADALVDLQERLDHPTRPGAAPRGGRGSRWPAGRRSCRRRRGGSRRRGALHEVAVLHLRPGRRAGPVGPLGRGLRGVHEPQVQDRRDSLRSRCILGSPRCPGPAAPAPGG